MNDSQNPGRANKTVLLVWLAVGALVIAALAWLLWPRSTNTDVTAQIWVDGAVVQSIYLPQAADGEISLAEYGHNVTLKIEGGRICFLSSDCPDKRCIHNGWLQHEDEQSTCLPNRVQVILTDGKTVGITLE